MENFAGSLLPVEIEQGSLKPNYAHKVRTRMKRSPGMKLFNPKIRTWISLRIISRVLPSSGILRGPEEEVAQSKPGGEV